MISKATKALVALLVGLMLLAGPPAAQGGGTRVNTTRVAAHSTDVYRVWVRAGQSAFVLVRGDGDTDLDLFVYDENGNLIDSDTDWTDRCVCRWRARWSGPFRIEVRNLGNVYNEYTIAITIR